MRLENNFTQMKVHAEYIYNEVEYIGRMTYNTKHLQWV